MSAARVLDIAELVNLISSFLSCNPSDLSRAARVSAFSPHALRHLWRTLPNALPIVNLIPAIQKHEGQYSFVRPPQADEWGPFRRYSPLVWEIQQLYPTDRWGREPNLAVGTYAAIEQYLQDTPFPHLQQLFFQQSDMDGPAKRHLSVMDARALLPSPLLTRVIISQSMSPESMEDDNANLINHYIEILSESAPLLRHLAIFGRPKPGVFRSLERFKYLEYVDLSFSHPTYSFRSLSDLKGLEELRSLNVLLLPVLLATPPSQPLARMGGVKKLALSGDLPSFRKICSAVPNVEHLVLNAQHSPTLQHASTWRAFFQTLPRTCPSLCALEIRSNFETEPRDEFKVFNHIEPLLLLSLQTFYISASGLPQTHLSDSEVHEIGLAWPNLQRLELFADATYASPNIPSVQALKALFRSCRDLCAIQMSIMNECLKLHTSLTDFHLASTFRSGTQE